MEQHLPVMMNGILQKSLNIRDDGCCLQHPDVTILEAGRVGHCHLCAMETKDAQLQFQLMGDTYTTLSSSFLFGTGESAASLSSNTQHSNSPVPQEKRSVGETKEQRRQQQQQQPLSSAEESLVEQKQQQVLLESILARWMQVQNQATTKGTDEEPQQQQQHLPRSLMALTIPLILNDLRKLASKVEGQQRIISNQSTQIQELKESLEEKHANTQDMLQTILQQVTKNASTTTTALATSASAPVDPSPRKQKLQKSSTAATPSVAASMASSSCPPLAAFSVTSVPASANVAGGSKNNSKAKSKEEKIFRAAPNSRRKMKRRPSASSKRSVRSLRSVDSSIKTPLTRHDSNKSFTLSELRMVSPAPPPQAKQSIAQQQQDATSKPLEIEFSSPLATAAKKTATNNISHDNNDNLEGSLNFNTLLTPMATTNNNAVTTTPMTDHSSRSRDITLDGSHHSLDHRDRDMPDLGAIFEDGLGDDMKSVKRKKFNLPANFGRTVEPMEIILEATLSGRHITGGKANNNNNNAGSNHGVLGTVGGEGSSNNNNSNHISNQHRRKLLPTSPEDVGLANDVDVTPYKYKTGKAKTMNTSTNTKNNKMAVVGHSSMQVFPTQEKVDVDVGLTGHMSLLMLDGRSASPDHDSDLSESIDSDEDDEDDETYYDDDDDDDLASYDQETLDDTTNNEPNDYSIENLKHEAGLEMIDMYGDRGTYSGTVAPDGDPTGFGTMKYDSGRFFKGKAEYCFFFSILSKNAKNFSVSAIRSNHLILHSKTRKGSGREADGMAREPC